MDNPKKNKNIKQKNFKIGWPLKMLLLAFVLSLSFSLLAEFLMSNAGLIVAIVVIVVFVSVSVITDMIGVAVTACTKEPFVAMSSKKVKGAKEGLMLIKNADKVASLCADVLGDVCGVLSGAAGASIVAKIAIDTSNVNLTLFVASLVTAGIAGLTIFGKALGKRIAINKCNSIILRLGKFIGIFVRDKKKKPVTQKSNEQSSVSEDGETDNKCNEPLE